MKKIWISLLPAVLVLSACLKSESTVNLPAPTGTFNGEFRLLHKKANQLKFDTVKANIQLVFTDNTNFKVLGDTALVHAGSKGTFEIGSGVSAGFMAFTDATYPKTGKPAKTHLNGVYQYYYDGNKFQMVANSADTLSLQYDLKR